MLVLLIKSIQCLDLNGEQVVIPEDTQVYFDKLEGVAFWNDIHFHLEPSEYITMN